jgi:hypothetical protein
LNGITSVPNFTKIYNAVQKLLVGDTHTHTYTDRQTGDLISLLSFFESRLIKETWYGLDLSLWGQDPFVGPYEHGNNF